MNREHRCGDEGPHCGIGLGSRRRLQSTRLRRCAQKFVDQLVQGKRARDVEREAQDPVHLQAPEKDLGDGKGKERGDPRRQAERMGGVIGEPLSREQSDVVENGRISGERQVQAAGQRHDQAYADQMPGNVRHRGQKKRYPEGYLFTD